MKSYNNVTLVGRAVADCSIYKTTGNCESIGYSVFTLAVERADKEKDGKRVTDFISVKAYGKLGPCVPTTLKNRASFLYPAAYRQPATKSTRKSSGASK